MKYLEYGHHSLSTEIKALQSLLNYSLNDTFEKVVDIILNTKGKVVLSAVGKPGYIAHKVAATLSSTGTPACYIHSDEASHGDLGMINNDDTLIVLSASGGSRELEDIVKYSKRFGIPVVGVTKKSDSFLSKIADVPIIFEDIEETNILKSPTTSTLMFLAYFDAITTALIDIKDFTIDKYKLFHPGGKLGASMVRISEIMAKDVPLCYETDNMQKVVDVMLKINKGCVGILNSDNKLIGVIADGDFKRSILKYKNILDAKITDVMATNPITIKEEQFAIEAVGIMQGNNKKNRFIQTLFVLDKINNVVGILHIQQLITAGVL